MMIILLISCIITSTANEKTAETLNTELNQYELAKKNTPKGTLSYKEARAIMYGYLDNENDRLCGIYTQKAVNVHKQAPIDITRLLFNPGTHNVQLNEGNMTETIDDIIATAFDNNKGINCEHTWPQSALKKCQVYEAVSDLHHLYPAYIIANQIRSNYPFGNANNTISLLIDETIYKLKDIEAGIGTQYDFDTKSEFDKINKIFEPREISQGNIARSIFYIALIYGESLFNESRFGGYATQQIEWFNQFRFDGLKWNKADKVSNKERERCLEINKIQGNINPFVIDETLVDKIFGTDEWLNVLRKYY